MKKLFLAWQEPKSRHWFPIGCLEFDGDKYHFFYIQGVKKAKCEGFTSVYSLPDLDKTYSSTELFPLFSNRLMPRSRPDYLKYIESLNNEIIDFHPRLNGNMLVGQERQRRFISEKRSIQS